MKRKGKSERIVRVLAGGPGEKEAGVAAELSAGVDRFRGSSRWQPRSRKQFRAAAHGRAGGSAAPTCMAQKSRLRLVGRLSELCAAYVSNCPVVLSSCFYTCTQPLPIQTPHVDLVWVVHRQKCTCRPVHYICMSLHVSTCSTHVYTVGQGKRLTYIKQVEIQSTIQY